MNTPIRVVIADDHPMFRFGLAAALAAAPEVEVVGEAADGAELVAQAGRLFPDVVLTDLSMPGTDGATAAAELTRDYPNIAVLVLTMHEDDDSLRSALRAGARGYLLKGADRDELVRAVMTVATGDSVYSPAVAQRIVKTFTADQSKVSTVFPQLTAREREILDLVAQGLGNHAIARRLTLSEKTVRNNVAMILTKIQATDRAAAVAQARDAGLGQGLSS